jgi:dTDP-4-dehydrorhamnose 3,5-epimerase
MIFTETPLKGAYKIDLDKKGDDRGFFARLFCINEFEKNGLNNKIIQINNSLSKDKGTLRGIHYQLKPKEENKIVRCIKGSLYDVIVDLREGSETFGKWFGVELSESNRTMLYVPEGFGHGFLTLREDTEAFYLVTEFYAPDYERGIRWNDPYFNIKWPIEPLVISEKDQTHPDFNKAYHLNM